MCSDGVLSAVPTNFVLAPSASQNVIVTYTPASEAPLAATVTVNSDDPDQASIVVQRDRQCAGGARAVGAAGVARCLHAAERSAPDDPADRQRQPDRSGVARLHRRRIGREGERARDHPIAPVDGTRQERGRSAPRRCRRSLPRVARMRSATGGRTATSRVVRCSTGWTSPASARAIPFTGDDQNLGPFPIGFNFPFYGTPSTTVQVCTNGWLSFTSTATTYTNTPLPAASTEPGEPGRAVLGRPGSSGVAVTRTTTTTVRASSCRGERAALHARCGNRLDRTRSKRSSTRAARSCTSTWT